MHETVWSYPVTWILIVGFIAFAVHMSLSVAKKVPYSTYAFMTATGIFMVISAVAIAYNYFLDHIISGVTLTYPLFLMVGFNFMQNSGLIKLREELKDLKVQIQKLQKKQ
jgi:hypothetical protein